MILTIKNIVYNLAAFDYVCPQDAVVKFRPRIAFFKDGHEVCGIEFDDTKDRDKAWDSVKEQVRSNNGI